MTMTMMMATAVMVTSGLAAAARQASSSSRSAAAGASGRAQPARLPAVLQRRATAPGRRVLLPAARRGRPASARHR
jgi:hypothetical protein